jgi:thiamine-monophosphate kinase
MRGIRDQGSGIRDPGSILGAGGEFDRIRRILARLGDRAVGIGDDCAILKVGGERLAISTDLSIENVHFKLGWLTPEEIGWRATAAALSDLAAVAATPLGVLVSLGVPGDWPGEHVADLMQGAGGVAASVGAVVLGGDLTRNDKTIINVTVVGRLDSEPVLRSGARTGDELWVTGALGGPGAALAAWGRGREPEASARERFACPQPRIREAQWLRERGAKALIDLSDGLVADASHIAAASGVRCTIALENIPVHGSAGSAEDALVSGEEYELLCVLPAGGPARTSAEFMEQFGLPLTRVGTISARTGVEILKMGKSVALPESFRHF